MSVWSVSKLWLQFCRLNFWLAFHGIFPTNLQMIFLLVLSTMSEVSPWQSSLPPDADQISWWTNDYLLQMLEWGLWASMAWGLDAVCHHHHLPWLVGNLECLKTQHFLVKLLAYHINLPPPSFFMVSCHSLVLHRRKTQRTMQFWDPWRWFL